MNHVTVIGAGLAGSECAWQLAQRGVAVTLREMKPEKRTPAHVTDYFAELCCSNSLRGAGLENAVGLLKEELRRLEEPEGTENAFLQEEFKAERARLEGRLAEIWREKKRMDALLAGLEENEQEYIRLRFEKGYGIDYIGRRLYISRATVFRMQDRILEKLRQAEIETL